MPLHRTAPRHATYYCPCIRIRTQAHAHVHAHAHVYALVCVTCTCVCNRMWHSGAAESAVPARDRQGGAHEGTPCGTHERMCVRAHAHRCVFARIHACLHAPACLHARTHAQAAAKKASQEAWLKTISLYARFRLIHKRLQTARCHRRTAD